MMRVSAIARRELRALFLSPAGYVVTALFVMFTGIVFVVRAFEPGQPASLRPVFEYGTWVLLFIAPAITMRAISEELRLGTLETLLTSPASAFEVILGKFVAAVGFLLVILLPTAAFVGALEIYGRPDYGELLCGYLGMMLAGSAYLASGLLASALTSSQVVAYLVAVFFWLVLSMATKLLPAYVGDAFSAAAIAADPDLRLRDFAIGLVDTANVVYFLSIAGMFLGLAVAALAARRWV